MRRDVENVKDFNSPIGPDSIRFKGRRRKKEKEWFFQASTIIALKIAGICVSIYVFHLFASVTTTPIQYA